MLIKHMYVTKTYTISTRVRFAYVETASKYCIALTYLHFHGVRINLAHVLSSVFPFHPANVQSPRVVVVVCNAQARIVCYHVFVNR